MVASPLAATAVGAVGEAAVDRLSFFEQAAATMRQRMTSPVA
jgi:hypothetical protein